MKDKFKTIFDEYFPQIVLYIHLKGIPLEDARDIAEETFVRFWTNRDHAMNLPIPRKWLYKAARNLFIDHIRHRNIVNEFKDDYYYRVDECDQIQAYALADAWTRLPELPPICRKVIELSLIGKKTAEIMEYLEISQQNVLNQKARGIKLLRDKLLNLQS